MSRRDDSDQIQLERITLGLYWSCLIALGVREKEPVDFTEIGKDRLALFLGVVLVDPVSYKDEAVARNVGALAWSSVVEQMSLADSLAGERADMVMDEIAHEPPKSGDMSIDRLLCQFEPHHLVPLLDMPPAQALAWMRGRGATESLKELKRKYSERMN